MLRVFALSAALLPRFHMMRAHHMYSATCDAANSLQPPMLTGPLEFGHIPLCCGQAPLTHMVRCSCTSWLRAEVCLIKAIDMATPSTCFSGFARLQGRTSSSLLSDVPAG